MNARKTRATILGAISIIVGAGLCGCPQPVSATGVTALVDENGDLVPLVQPGYWRIVVRPDEPLDGEPEEFAYYIKLELSDTLVYPDHGGIVDPVNSDWFEGFRWAQWGDHFEIDYWDADSTLIQAFVATIESGTYLKGEHKNGHSMRLGEFEMWLEDIIPVEIGPDELTPIE